MRDPFESLYGVAFGIAIERDRMASRLYEIRNRITVWPLQCAAAVLIAAIAVALNAGCVATYVKVQPDPVRVTVWRAALVYRADCRITQNGVESYNGRPDSDTVKAVSSAPWWMKVIAWFKGG